MTAVPLVSFVILSWNRIDDLRFVLGRLAVDPYPSREIIVVDNASSDGTVDMVQEEFPEVRIIPLAENIGIAGWNEGFAHARGPYVFVLDDDSYPVGTAVTDAVRYLEESPACGVLGLRIFNERLDTDETALFTPGAERTFIGCGAVIRNEVIALIGGFDRHLFLYEHETEYAMRVLQAGFSVDFLPSAVVHHLASVKNRGLKRKKDCRRVYYTTRNIMYIMMLHFPLQTVLFRMVRIFVGRLVGGTFAGCGWSALRGLLGGMWLGIRWWKKRELLDSEICSRYGYGNYAGGMFFEDSAYSFKRPFFLPKSAK